MRTGSRADVINMAPNAEANAGGWSSHTRHASRFCDAPQIPLRANDHRPVRGDYCEPHLASIRKVLVSQARRIPDVRASRYAVVSTVPNGRRATVSKRDPHQVPWVVPRETFRNSGGARAPDEESIDGRFTR